MAQQIIAKGKVQRHPILGWHLFDPHTNEWVGFDAWAKQYQGKTLVISLEEPEEEQESILNPALATLVAEA